MNALVGQSFSVSAFYFLVFLGNGSYLPFFPLWMQSIGFSGPQIGIIAASPSFVMVLSTIIIGSIADKAADWRTAIIICNCIIAVLVTGLFFLEGFHAIWLMWTLWSVVMLAMAPILDAATIRMSRHRNLRYHRIRAIGSIGFIVGVYLAGVAIDSFGIGVFLYLLIGLAWLRLLACITLPRFKAGIDTSTESSPAMGASTDSLKSPWFVVALTGSACISASHAYFYTMGSVIWVTAGYSAGTVSALWILGVVIEVAVMWWFSGIAKRFSARRLLIFAGAIACFRWSVFAQNPGFYLLLFTQSLHGLTFGILFMATINFIANWTPVVIAAKAQAVAATLNTGIMAVAMVVSGSVYALLGVKGYWLMFVLCLIGVALLIGSLKSQPTERE